MRQFMRVPQRIHNAVMLMVDLAQNNRPGVFVSLAEVAERQGLSRGFLEEIVPPLRSAKLIEAKRGSHGGYRLVGAPDEISIGDIVTAVEGPLALVECLGDAGCAASPKCASKMVWRNMQGRIEDALASISLVDVMGKI